MRQARLAAFVITGALVCADVAAQEISVRHRGATAPRAERATADISGAPDCAAPTFRVRRSYATSPEAGVVTASGQDEAMLKAIGVALGACRKVGAVVRVIDVSEGTMLERRQIPSEIDRYRTDEIAAWLAGQRAPQPGMRRVREPRPLTGAGMRPEFISVVAPQAAALRDTPVSEGGAWRSRVGKLARALKGAEPFAAATCNVSTFQDGSLDTFFRVAQLQGTCAEMASTFGVPAPETVTDLRQRREYDRKLGPIATSLYAPRQWLDARASNASAQIEAYLAQPNTHSSQIRALVKALEPARGSPALASLSESLSARATALAESERIASAAAAEASRVRREAEARAQRERQAAAALAAAAAKASAEADKTERLRALRGGGGPSAYDVIGAIRTEHFQYSNYRAAGPFGVLSGTHLFPTLATAAREYDITSLRCTPAQSGYSCTYALTRRWTTDQFDQSGLMAGLEAFANALGQGVTGRNLQVQTVTQTDTFRRVGGVWRSPTWAAGLEEAARRARETRTCTTSRERSGTGFAVRGNRLLGAWPEYKTVTRC